MGDLEYGYEEMQGVKLGYLLIKGKQMFALSQVFTDLLKNIPRTTVHKRMDHLKVKKHHCDLEELRKLKAINSIAFHAAKCTLISREDVEALYVSCKTERVLKSSKRKAACSSGDEDASAGLWKEKVWFSLHGVPELHSRNEQPRCDAKLPQYYHKAQGRDHRSVSKISHKHFKNYETDKTTSRNSFFRQPVVFQSAVAAQSRRTGGDLVHKRKRRCDGGGSRSSRHAHQHAAPLLLLQPKTPAIHGDSSFGAFHLSPDFYLDHRPHHHQHVPSFPESYSSDTESSTCPDSDFGSGFSTSSNSGSSEEEEDEDDTQSESSEISSEEESSSQSDSSSVSSRVSVQSIRFRRAGVGSLSKSPLVLQPTFHYNNHQEKEKQHSTLCYDATSQTGQKCESKGNLQTCQINSRECLFYETTWEKVCEVDFHADPLKNSLSFSSGHDLCKASQHSHKTLGYSVFPPQSDPNKPQKSVEKTEPKACQKLPAPTTKIKTELDDLPLTTASHSDCSRTVRTPPFDLHNVKVKVEESCDEYEYQKICDGQYSTIKEGDFFSNEIKAAERSPDVAPSSPCAPQECQKEGEHMKKNPRTSVQGLRKGRQNASRTTSATSSSSSTTSSSPHPAASEETSTEDLPSRRKGKTLFSLMASFPSPPSLIVGTDGDLCPAYSLNSQRSPGPPPLSHPVWRWQPGGQILPPPLHAQKTRKY